MQRSVLGPLLFLIYINNLPDGITSICKIFADDTSLFSKAIDKCNIQNALNSDLESISNWAYQLKLQFNIDLKKQANEVIFSRKSIHMCIHQPNSITMLSLNVVIRSTWVSFLIPNLTLTFILKIKKKKCNKIIGLIRRLSVSLPRKALLIFTNLLSGLISTTVIFCMINQTIKILKINLKRFSTKFVLQ